MSNLIYRVVHWLKQFIQDPEYKLAQVALRFIGEERLPDRMVIKYQFHNVFGYPLDLKHPQTFNEKLQWLKLYNRNPLYTTLVDKYRVKHWVAEKIGEQYVIPTLAVYDSVDDIDLDKLPNQFVLKCNHDSGSVVICRDKLTFDFAAAKRILQNGLNTDFYLKHREWPYKNVKRCIIAEKYLEPVVESIDIASHIMDYRIYCFDGNPLMIYAYTNYLQSNNSKPEPSNCDYFDVNWQPLPYIQRSQSRGNIERPKELSCMLDAAQQMSKDIPFARIDFYETDKLYLGEITFYPGAGLSKFHPHIWDKKIGEHINLQKCNIRERKNMLKGGVIYDYKFFCFNGKPRFMYIGADKAENPTSDFFDMEFNHLPIRMTDPNAETPPQKPKEFEELKRVATVLCKGFPHVRVDFYVVSGQIYFGEMTFFHMAGLSPVKPLEWNLRVGNWLKLPKR